MFDIINIVLHYIWIGGNNVSCYCGVQYDNETELNNKCNELGLILDKSRVAYVFPTIPLTNNDIIKMCIPATEITSPGDPSGISNMKGGKQVFKYCFENILTTFVSLTRVHNGQVTIAIHTDDQDRFTKEMWKCRFFRESGIIDYIEIRKIDVYGIIHQYLSEYIIYFDKDQKTSMKLSDVIIKIFYDETKVYMCITDIIRVLGNIMDYVPSEKIIGSDTCLNIYCDIDDAIIRKNKIPIENYINNIIKKIKWFTLIVENRHKMVTIQDAGIFSAFGNNNFIGYSYNFLADEMIDGTNTAKNIKPLLIRKIYAEYLSKNILENIKIYQARYLNITPWLLYISYIISTTGTTALVNVYNDILQKQYNYKHSVDYVHTDDNTMYLLFTFMDECNLMFSPTNLGSTQVDNYDALITDQLYKTIDKFLLAHGVTGQHGGFKKKYIKYINKLINLNKKMDLFIIPIY